MKINLFQYNNEGIIKRVNPWDVTLMGRKFLWKKSSYLAYRELSFPKEMRDLFGSKVKEYLNHPENLEAIKPFEDPIDKEEYRDYLKHVPYEIYFFKILKRLDKNMYHNSKGVM